MQNGICQELFLQLCLIVLQMFSSFPYLTVELLPEGQQRKVFDHVLKQTMCFG